MMVSVPNVIYCPVLVSVDDGEAHARWFTTPPSRQLLLRCSTFRHPWRSPTFPLQGEGVRIQQYLERCREVASGEGSSAAFGVACRASTPAHLKTCFGTTLRTLLFPPLQKAMSELAVAADGGDGKYSLKYFDE